MLTPARFLVVDDKPLHLTAIMACFQKLGSPCLGIHYLPEVGLNPGQFRGVRGLFMDLHLIDGAASTDNRRHYAQIAAILEDNISPLGGPFVLIIWTEHAHLGEELKGYLDVNLDPAKPYARPLAILSMAKEQFINVQTGSEKAAAGLLEAITGILDENSQLAALISWETDVLAAAGATLAALLELVPSAECTSAGFSNAVDGILSRLAQKAVGRGHVDGDPRAAINAALAPILADRVASQKTTQAAAAMWKKAVTRNKDKALGEATAYEAGHINRMLHLALKGSELIHPGDWGAVSDFPAELWNDNGLRALFGLSLAEFMGDELKINKPDRSACRPVVVRIGASCDHAQNRRGPIGFLAGIEIPGTIERIKAPNGHVMPPKSEWLSPALMTGKGDGPFRLAVNCRYAFTRPRAACDSWTPRYRMREQLLMELISHSNGYMARPGIVNL